MNPRLVKEADTLADNGYDVTVLYAYWNEWGTNFDKDLIPQKKWKALRIGGDPSEKPAIYFISRAIHKFAKLINKISNGKLLSELAIARSGYFLIRAARKQNADLYIGHNIGALAPTLKAAKANRRPCGFDAEDFHRHEVSDNINNPDVALKTNIENRYFHHLDYLSASSPLIAEAYQRLFPEKEPVVILNVFPNNLEIEKPIINQTDTIKLFWFSQTIGMNRGLENVIKALQLLKRHSFELHLLGYLSEETKNILVGGDAVKMHFHAPISPDALPAFSSQFDIGLALEPGFSINNNLALSNKIFTYLQGGLAIIASDTDAQYQLIHQYPSIGKTYQKNDPQSLADALLYYYQNRQALFETRQAALTLAKEELNWENEGKKFLNLVEQTLDNHLE